MFLVNEYRFYEYIIMVVGDGECVYIVELYF